jgi:hypothetical protein
MDDLPSFASSLTLLNLNWQVYKPWIFPRRKLEQRVRCFQEIVRHRLGPSEHFKMLLRLSTICVFLSATLSIAHPSSDNVQLVGRSYPEYPSKRPSVSCHPKSPGQHHPPSPSRSKTCYIKSHNDSKTDDSAYVLSALHSCNNGGHVVFKKGVSYLIGKALDLTFLNHIDIGQFHNFSLDKNIW